jgi:hypothetical protein
LNFQLLDKSDTLRALAICQSIGLFFEHLFEYPQPLKGQVRQCQRLRLIPLTMSQSMEQLLPSNLLLRDGAFVFTQSYLDGVNPVAGGIESAMANTDQMIKHVRYGE